VGRQATGVSRSRGASVGSSGGESSPRRDVPAGGVAASDADGFRKLVPVLREGRPAPAGLHSAAQDIDTCRQTDPRTPPCVWSPRLGACVLSFSPVYCCQMSYFACQIGQPVSYWFHSMLSWGMHPCCHASFPPASCNSCLNFRDLTSSHLAHQGERCMGPAQVYSAERSTPHPDLHGACVLQPASHEMGGGHRPVTIDGRVYEARQEREGLLRVAVHRPELGLRCIFFAFFIFWTQAATSSWLGPASLPATTQSSVENFTR
jgi:hypothetical protein